ncbi:Alpha/Beta hydrolase protein [Paraphysoderma sedebokerense]|nr:Alpha/Beta hydrolase protein [Paraphysoderma sedebokerense]
MPYATVGEKQGRPVKIYYEIHHCQNPVDDEEIVQSEENKHRILFIMGLNATGHGWKLQTDYFSQFPNFTAVTFDNRGVGKSESPPSRYTTAEMAMDAYELMQHLGWNSAHIVGVSMGGMIAQKFALAFPWATVSLTLTSTQAGLGVVPIRGQFIGLRGVINLLLEKDVLAAKTRNILRILYPPKFLKSKCPDGVRTWKEYLYEFHYQNLSSTPLQSIDGIKGQLHAVITHYISKKELKIIKSCGIPAVVITGTDDFLISHKNSISIAKALAAPLYIFEDVGHAVLVQKSEEYNQILHTHFELAVKKRESRMNVEASELRE